MALKDDLNSEVKKILKDQWTVRDGQVVPEPASIGLGNEAIRLERATILYADLAASTSLVDTKSWQFAAEIYRTYLHCAAKLIRNEGGTIAAYDGDRVMGIFIGSNQSTNAVKCGMKIKYAVDQIINPAIKAQYQTDYILRQIVGIDTSQIHVARTGVRGDNDLVWIGRAANYAAKLTSLDASESTWITKAVFDIMNAEVKVTNGQLMWKKWSWAQMNNIEVHSSTWHWSI